MRRLLPWVLACAFLGLGASRQFAVDIDLVSGSGLKVGGVAVIDSSRAATVSALVSTGQGTFDGAVTINRDGDPWFTMARNGGQAWYWEVNTSLGGDMRLMDSSASVQVARFGTNANGKGLTVAGGLTATTGTFSAGGSTGLSVTNSNSSVFALQINNTVFGSTAATAFGLYQHDSGTGYISNNNNSVIAIAPSGSTTFSGGVSATTGTFTGTVSGADLKTGSDEAFTYDEGSFEGTLTGITGTATATIQFARAGKLVSLSYGSVFTGTSNATTCTITGVPAALRPYQYVTAAVPVTNNGNVGWGHIEVGADGILYFGNNIAGTSLTDFVASGSKGVPYLAVTYPKN